MNAPIDKADGIDKLRDKLEKLEVPKFVVWLDDELKVETNNLTNKTVNEIIELTAQYIRSEIIGEDELVASEYYRTSVNKRRKIENALKAEMRERLNKRLGE